MTTCQQLHHLTTKWHCYFIPQAILWLMQCYASLFSKLTLEWNSIFQPLLPQSPTLKQNDLLCTDMYMYMLMLSASARKVVWHYFQVQRFVGAMIDCHLQLPKRFYSCFFTQHFIFMSYFKLNIFLDYTILISVIVTQSNLWNQHDFGKKRELHVGNFLLPIGLFVDSKNIYLSASRESFFLQFFSLHLQ